MTYTRLIKTYVFTARIALSFFMLCWYTSQLIAQNNVPTQPLFRPGSTGQVQPAGGLLSVGSNPPRAQSLSRQPGTPGTRGPAQKSNPQTIEDIKKEEQQQHLQYNGLPVASIEFKGNSFLTGERLYDTIKTRIDRSFDSVIVQEDVRSLYGTGLIRDVQLLIKKSKLGLHLTFEIFERPTIATVRFIGNRMYLDKKLTKETDLKSGDALDLFSIEDATRKIEELYHENGFPKAHVKVLEGLKPGERNVVFYISEGPREKIAAVEVVGNDPYLAQDARLLTLFESKARLSNWIIGGDYIPSKVENDMEKLVTYYRNLGYFQATVGRQIDYDDSGHWVTLRFIVNEGPRYRITNVRIEGNKQVSKDLLSKLITISSGDYFLRNQLGNDLESIKDLYGKLGYIYSKVNTDIRFRETPGELEIVFEVDEGEQFKVGEIAVHIAGISPHTKNSVILNRLSLIPGDLASNQEMRSSERRLRHSSLFNDGAMMGSPPTIVVRTEEIKTQPKKPGLPPAPNPKSATEPTTNTIRGQSPVFSRYEPVNRTSAYPLPQFIQRISNK
tara:strand:- start:287 stop:1957 length:1671 start_codon:yes stop_codon:yes gene_type:complete